jgi:hypothetical protein
MISPKPEGIQHKYPTQTYESPDPEGVEYNPHTISRTTKDPEGVKYKYPAEYKNLPTLKGSNISALISFPTN